MPGPLPNAHRRRRNAPTIPTTALAATGRPGPVPRPPAWIKLDKVGRAFWNWAWRTPAACAWSEDVDGPAVARRALLEEKFLAENDGNLLPRMLLLDDRLGLSPWARAKNRWSIVPDDDAPSAEVEDELTQRRASIRDRMNAASN
jgi:hypothetical protein